MNDSDLRTAISGTLREHGPMRAPELRSLFLYVDAGRLQRELVSALYVGALVIADGQLRLWKPRDTWLTPLETREDAQAALSASLRSPAADPR